MLIDNRELPRIGFGTYGMGGTNQEADTTHDARDIAAIRYAVDHGLTFVNGAQVYGNSHTDELIGHATFDKPHAIVASKLGEKTLTNVASILPDTLAIAKRLQRSTINLHYIHRFYDDLVLENCIPAMCNLVNEGIVGDIGVSNFSLPQLKQANEIAHSLSHPLGGNHRIAAIENVFGPFNRGEGPHPTRGWFQPGFSKELREYCNTHQIAMIGYTSINKGTIIRSGIIRQIADSHNATAFQISLAWSMAHDIIPLVKSSRPEHINENLGALDIHLSQEEIQQIDGLAAPGRKNVLMYG